MIAGWGMLVALVVWGGTSSLDGASSRPAEPVARIIVFVARGCSACEVVEPWRLRALGRRLHLRIQPHYYPIDEPANLKLLEAYERYLGRGRGMPVVVVGKTILHGEREVSARLEEVLRRVASTGGIDFTELPPRYRPQLASRPVTPSPRKAIYIAHFYQPGCRRCRRVSHILRYLRRTYPKVLVREFDTSEPANKRLLWAMAAKVGLPKERRLITPMVFVDQRVFVGGEATLTALEEAVRNPSWEQIPPPWEVDAADLEMAEAGIEYQFRRMDFWTVAGAALADGVNPCAFATILFLVAYLTALGRTRREVLACGGAFTLGVLTAYFCVGLGLKALLGMARALEGLNVWLFRLAAFLCLLLGVVSVLDYLRARRGGLKEMKLVLPERWRLFTRSLIARRLRSAYLVPASLLLGVVVSVVELACTGQVYLPTILYVIASTQDTPGRAYGLLVLYNLLFILPLVVVFGLVGFGLGSRRLAEFAQRHLAKTKLALAVVFVLLGVGLIAFSLA